MNCQTNQITKLQTALTSVILDRLRAAYLASHFIDPASLPALPYAIYWRLSIKERPPIHACLSQVAPTLHDCPPIDACPSQVAPILHEGPLIHAYLSQVAPTLHECPPTHACLSQLAPTLHQCPPIHARVFHVTPTLHDLKYPLLYIIVLNVPLISTLIFTLKKVCETLFTDYEGWVHVTGIIL